MCGKALADYVHSKGLRLGLYTDSGLYTCNKGKTALLILIVEVNSLRNKAAEITRSQEATLITNKMPSNSHRGESTSVKLLSYRVVS